VEEKTPHWRTKGILGQTPHGDKPGVHKKRVLAPLWHPLRGKSDPDSIFLQPGTRAAAFVALRVVIRRRFFTS
jgi:hypothetical protein